MRMLGEDSDLPEGTRDALHVPYVVCRMKEERFPEIILGETETQEQKNERWRAYYKKKEKDQCNPGDWVKFSNSTFSEVEKCTKEEAHGIVDPFLQVTSFFDRFIVLLVPGMTSEPLHSFEINPDFLKLKKEMLEYDLKQSKEEDSDCAECYEIRNNRIIRN